MTDSSNASKPDLAALAQKNGVSVAAVEAALGALRNGHGRQAQFSHPDLGGMGQWSRGGMLMIGDMFNDRLKATVAGLFDDLLPYGDAPPASGGEAGSSSRWPASLGHASSTGSQNGVHYAVFPETRRLAIKEGGKVTLYDTGRHRINGVSQQQGGGRVLHFTGPDGSVAITDLPIVDGEAGGAVERERPSDAPPAPAPEKRDVVAEIGRLHELLSKGALTQDEFDAAKRRLLDQL
ncbi:SHOCT domain-containing protein [Sphingobium sufflavum]|uniref:SHOCT domain-containing protein n=1 Tax=Sphingobium sufflavum TaxID=1129547 RepID=UPI001F2A5D9E|nr:SHOCT domain-containing protein [Sphingobium sufflavum]MCE7797268.1 SHOCT domain-containing protein [Sphingobium sufflavum]